MRKLLLLSSLGVLMGTAQTPSTRLSVDLLSLINSNGNGIPTTLVLNGPKGVLSIVIPAQGNDTQHPPGIGWSDPFDKNTVWQVQHDGVTYSLTGESLLNSFITNGSH